MFSFTPVSTTSIETKVPFYEEARADFAPYYRSRKTIASAKVEVIAELVKLEGTVRQFTQGIFEIIGQTRHGFEIQFVYGGSNGLIRVAGLPILKSETTTKVNVVLVQALLNVRDWLKAVVTAKTFNPGHDPLIGHLLLPDGKTTIRDYIIQSGQLPMLGDGTGE